jgi:hypothetical protein
LSHTARDVEALRAHNELDLELYRQALARTEPELAAFRKRAVSLARADIAMSRRRPVADLAAIGYVADYASSVLVAHARRGWAATWRYLGSALSSMKRAVSVESQAASSEILSPKVAGFDGIAPMAEEIATAPDSTSAAPAV